MHKLAVIEEPVYSIRNDPRYKKLCAVVDIDLSYARNVLWREYAEDAGDMGIPGDFKCRWKEYPGGHQIRVGTFAGEPVYLSMMFEELDGHLFGFYEAVSETVHWPLISLWLDTYTRTPGGNLPRRADANNIASVIRDIRSRVGVPNPVGVSA